MHLLLLAGGRGQRHRRPCATACLLPAAYCQVTDHALLWLQAGQPVIDQGGLTDPGPSRDHREPVGPVQGAMHEALGLDVTRVVAIEPVVGIESKRVCVTVMENFAFADQSSSLGGARRSAILSGFAVMDGLVTISPAARKGSLQAACKAMGADSD